MPVCILYYLTHIGIRLIGVCTFSGLLKVWNLSSLVYSSSLSDHLSENSCPGTVTDSSQVITSAFYCSALDAICVTTHEHNIMFYRLDGLQQFRQVLQIVSLLCQS